MGKKVIVVDFTAKRKKTKNKSNIWIRTATKIKNLFSFTGRHNKTSKIDKCYNKNIY